MPISPATSLAERNKNKTALSPVWARIDQLSRDGPNSFVLFPSPPEPNIWPPNLRSASESAHESKTWLVLRYKGPWNPASRKWLILLNKPASSILALIRKRDLASINSAPNEAHHDSRWRGCLCCFSVRPHFLVTLIIWLTSSTSPQSCCNRYLHPQHLSSPQIQP